jgi:hypothetical protein
VLFRNAFTAFLEACRKRPYDVSQAMAAVIGGPKVIGASDVRLMSKTVIGLAIDVSNRSTPGAHRRAQLCKEGRLWTGTDVALVRGQRTIP